MIISSTNLNIKKQSKNSLPMKSKMLFWLGPDYTHYCISHYMQKLHDCELYGIIDIPNKQKKFFDEQNLVNIKKKWFIFDHLTKNYKVDLEYLETFQNEYKINLWSLAINERLFYRFSFQNFKSDEILAILEQECRLFEKILDEVKPDFLITKWASRHYHQLLIELCKNKGIKILQLGQPKIGYKMLISEDPAKFDGIENLDSITSKNRDFTQLQNFVKKFSMSKNQKEFDSRKQSKLGFINTGIEYIFSKNEVNENYYNYFFGSSKLKNIEYQLTSPSKRKHRKKFLDSLSKDLPSKPFVYYPLAVDMERNLLINAPFYTNQIELIRSIAKSLPINFTLVVKENPAQVSRDWRSLDDYKEILEIPNVFLVNPNIPYDELLKKCSLVVLIGGSTGYEAAFYGKPSITFSNMIYSILPSVYRVKNLEELPYLIKSAISHKPEPESLDKYLTLIEENTFDFDHFAFLTNFGNIFYREDRINNVEIPIEKMQIFLNDNKTQLENLTLEHIKKINWHNQNG